MKISLTLFALLFALFAWSQDSIPTRFIGKWISSNGTGSGYEITTHSIRRIQVQRDSIRKVDTTSRKYLVIDTVIAYHFETFEPITYSEYASQESVLPDGSKSFIDTLEFQAYRLDLLPDDILKLSASKRFSFTAQNQKPVVTTDELHKIVFKYRRADRTYAVYLKRYIQ